MQYTFHSDPGHGWLEVPKSELVRLGVADKISTYSYQNGGMVYLEEDCDAGVFIEAKKAHNEPFKIKERNEPKNDSIIRRYPQYR